MPRLTGRHVTLSGEHGARSVSLRCPRGSALALEARRLTPPVRLAGISLHGGSGIPLGRAAHAGAPAAYRPDHGASSHPSHTRTRNKALSGRVVQWSAVTVFGPSIRDYAGAVAPHPELHGCQLHASGSRAACTCAVDESSTCPFSLDADEFGEMALSAGFDIGAPASPPDSAAAVEGQRRAVVAMLRKVSLGYRSRLDAFARD